MPKPAQDSVTKGPFAALLILFSLFLSSGTAAAGNGNLQSSARLSAGRQGATAAILQSSVRPSEDEAAEATGEWPPLLPPGAGIVTAGPYVTPAAGASSASTADLPRLAPASYQARAPPAA